MGKAIHIVRQKVDIDLFPATMIRCTHCGWLAPEGTAYTAGNACTKVYQNEVCGGTLQVVRG